jgi:hypothetical protein
MNFTGQSMCSVCFDGTDIACCACKDEMGLTIYVCDDRRCIEVHEERERRGELIRRDD